MSPDAGMAQKNGLSSVHGYSRYHSLDLLMELKYAGALFGKGGERYHGDISYSVLRHAGI